MSLLGLALHQRGGATCPKPHSRSDRVGAWTLLCLLALPSQGSSPLTAPIPLPCREDLHHEG